MFLQESSVDLSRDKNNISAKAGYGMRFLPLFKQKIRVCSLLYSDLHAVSEKDLLRCCFAHSPNKRGNIPSSHRYLTGTSLPPKKKLKKQTLQES